MSPEFLRRDNKRYSKLGKGRKKKLRWKKPTGRDNKMREKRKGYPATVNVGYGGDKKILGKLKGKTPITILNPAELVKIKKGFIGVVGNVGKKNKLEIAKKAKEMKVEIYNMNVDQYLKQKEVQKKEKAKEEKK